MTADREHNATPEEQIAQRFACDTASHGMTVLRDDGLYRHLHFVHVDPDTGKRGSIAYPWFDLITVPGALIFRGDGSSFVFSRTQDMLAFFRGSAHRGQPNYGYWAQKLTSDDSNAMRYNQDLMAARVGELVEEFISSLPAAEEEPAQESAPSGLAPLGPGEKLRDFVPVLETPRHASEVSDRLRVEVQEEVLDALSGDYSLDLNTLSGFRFHIKPNPSYKDAPDFEFNDPWELGVKEFDWWFLWACQAIVWGIRQYDASLPVVHVTSWWQRPLGRLGIKTGALCNTKIVAQKDSGPSRECRECQRAVRGETRG